MNNKVKKEMENKIRELHKAEPVKLTKEQMAEAIGGGWTHTFDTTKVWEFDELLEFLDGLGFNFNQKFIDDNPKVAKYCKRIEK